MSVICIEARVSCSREVLIPVPHETVVVECFSKHVSRLIVGVNEDAPDTLCLDFVPNAIRGKVEVFRQFRHTSLLRYLNSCLVVNGQCERSLNTNL